MTVREYMRLYDRLARAYADYQAASGWVERDRAMDRIAVAYLDLTRAATPRRLSVPDQGMVDRLLGQVVRVCVEFERETAYARQAGVRLARDVRDGKLVEG